ncbi:MAG TPA: hypothetical protein VFQ53_37530 [Kofleriaceae bacterium]|nr:hypothetical protein [Kofleriaceae bacterium]
MTARHGDVIVSAYALADGARLWATKLSARADTFGELAHVAVATSDTLYVDIHGATHELAVLDASTGRVVRRGDESLHAVHAIGDTVFDVEDHSVNVLRREGRQRVEAESVGGTCVLDGQLVQLHGWETPMLHALEMVRSAAAQGSDSSTRTATSGCRPIALLQVLADPDALHPGVAHAFWATVQYQPSPLWDDAVYDAHVRPWLEARRERRDALSPVPGNNLEFYAHEVFDGDAIALGRLLDWGYEFTVEMALDHGAVSDADVRRLRKRLYARSPSLRRARGLAVGLWPRHAGDRNSWRRSPDRLDPAAIGHIPLPALDGVTWRTEHWRGDVEVRIARDDATSHVRLIQIVQAFVRR